MKHTIVGLIVFLLVVLLPTQVQAFTIPNIRVIPSATPIPAKVILPVMRQRVTIIPVDTATPTIKVTATNTPTPTKAVVPTNAVTVTETPVTTLQPTIDLSPTVGVTAINDGDQDNLTIWFLAATIGLLLIIVIAQAWPKKDKEN